MVSAEQWELRRFPNEHLEAVVIVVDGSGAIQVRVLVQDDLETPSASSSGLSQAIHASWPSFTVLSFSLSLTCLCLQLLHKTGVFCGLPMRPAFPCPDDGPGVEGAAQAGIGGHGGEEVATVFHLAAPYTPIVW